MFRLNSRRQPPAADLQGADGDLSIAARVDTQRNQLVVLHQGLLAADDVTADALRRIAAGERVDVADVALDVREVLGLGPVGTAPSSEQ